MGKVLRLRKAVKGSEELNTDDLQALRPLYYDAVVNTFMGSKYAIGHSVVQVSETFLRDISERIEPSRPERRMTTPIDTNLSVAFLLKDCYSGAFDYSVEVKPKWGLYCKDEAGKSLFYCKFCRLQSSKSYDIGSYCPLDLFDGDSNRLNVALSNLFDTPRNQLRVYSNGRSVDIDKDTLIPRLVTILSKDPLLKRISLAHDHLFHTFKEREMITSDPYVYFDSLRRWVSEGIFSDPVFAFLTEVAIEDLSFIINFNHGTPDYSIKIIDVDIKSPLKLAKYAAEHDGLIRLGQS